MCKDALTRPFLQVFPLPNFGQEPLVFFEDSILLVGLPVGLLVGLLGGYLGGYLGVKKKPAFSAGRVDYHGARFSLFEPEFIFVRDVFLIRREDGRLRREQ